MTAGKNEHRFPIVYQLVKLDINDLARRISNWFENSFTMVVFFSRSLDIKFWLNWNWKKNVTNNYLKTIYVMRHGVDGFATYFTTKGERLP